MKIVNGEKSPFRLGSAICGQAALCLLIVAQCALANPTGGSVTHGNARITNSGTTTTITQTSNKAIINWHDFSINPNETTQFKQPSANSFTLNRVTGSNMSQIMGQLKANGNIYLINPNGILFGKNARVDVGGLVASTSPISDNEFLNSSLQHFTQSPKGASIINHGNITIKNAGLAVLVAPNVINDGVISADLGVVSIASADHFTLDLYGDNLINLDAGSVLSANGLVQNNGVIQANGGKINITAQAAGDLLENVVNLDGVVQAESVGKHQGKIVLQGYDNSVMNIIGSVNLSGDLGGFMKVTADNINVAPTAVIHADALQNGNGGQVGLFANNTTQVHGTITAHGGAQSGNGGFIETSAHNVVDLSGAYISASAAHGMNGVWLTDPQNADVTDGDAAAYSATLNLGTDVTIWANDDITFSNFATPVAWSLSAAKFNVRADADQLGNGTIKLDTVGGCVAGVNCLVSTSSGTINFYYNPTSFPTPDSFPSVSVSGSGVFNPYMLINAASDFAAINTNNTTLSRYYALNKDINVGATNPLGGAGTGNVFSGHFTGAVYQDDTNTLTQFNLSNVTINAPATDDIGFFGVINNATLSNILLTTPSVTGQSNTGGVVGRAIGVNNISDITVSGGTVNAGFRVGGIMGWLNGGGSTVNGVMSNSSDVTGVNHVGGLMGETACCINFNGNWTNSGTVTGTGVGYDQDIGGVIGNAQGNFTANLTNTGDVYAPLADFVGGVLGTQYFAVFSGTLADTGGNITGFDIVGGLIGNSDNGRFTGPWVVTRSSASTITSNTYSGGLVGNLGGGFTPSGASIAGIITPSSVTVSGPLTITGTGLNGGLIGVVSSPSIIWPGTITNPFTVLSTGDYVGGAIGYLDINNTTPPTAPYIPIMTGNLANAANISGANNVGGIFGGVVDNTVLPGNYTQVSGTISGTSNVGGLIGNFNNSSVTGTLVFNGGSVTGSGSSIGGVVGTSNGTVTQAEFISGSVSGDSQVGGIFGSNSGTVNKAVVAGGTINGNTTDIGGIVGYNAGTLSDVSFNGTVSAASANNVGGIVGNNDGSVQYSLGIGQVTGVAGTLGALIGLNSATGQLLDSIYDTNINTVSDVGSNLGTVTNVYAGDYTTLGNLSTYTAQGFNPAIWQLISGKYASLIWCGSSCMEALYVPPAPPTPPIPPDPAPAPITTPDAILATAQIVQTQIVSAENTFAIQPLFEPNINLVLSYASALLSQMNFTSDAQGMMASWFVTNSIILQIGDLVQQTGDTDPIIVMQEVVTALQDAHGCAAP